MQAFQTFMVVDVAYNNLAAADFFSLQTCVHIHNTLFSS